MQSEALGCPVQGWIPNCSKCWRMSTCYIYSYHIHIHIFKYWGNINLGLSVSKNCGPLLWGKCKPEDRINFLWTGRCWGWCFFQCRAVFLGILIQQMPQREVIMTPKVFMHQKGDFMYKSQRQNKCKQGTLSSKCLIPYRLGSWGSLSHTKFDLCTSSKAIWNRLAEGKQINQTLGPRRGCVKH